LDKTEYIQSRQNQVNKVLSTLCVVRALSYLLQANFKLLFWNLHGGAKEKHKISVGMARPITFIITAVECISFNNFI
jgi:hypothetical protein